MEMMWAFRTLRRSAVKARMQAANQLQGLRATAPDEPCRRLRGLSTKELVAMAARFRPSGDPEDVEAATRFAMRLVTRRH